MVQYKDRHEKANAMAAAMNRAIARGHWQTFEICHAFVNEETSAWGYEQMFLQGWISRIDADVHIARCTSTRKDRLVNIGGKYERMSKFLSKIAPLLVGAVEVPSEYGVLFENKRFWALVQADCRTITLGKSGEYACGARHVFPEMLPDTLVGLVSAAIK